MGRGARPAKAKVEARSTVTRRLRKADASTGVQLKQRLAEALEQHAAISEILQVISASPSDVQPVLDAVAERAARLCEAPLARVLLVDRDVLRLMAEYSLDGAPQAGTVPLPLRRSSISGRAIIDRATIHHDDVVPLLDSEYPDALNARRLGIRAALAVPLMREGNAYGAIFLWRREPGLFSPEQVALVQTFAQQAAIAVDNVRLFEKWGAKREESLQQQTATADVLKVISRSAFDLQTVLDTLTESACKLCDAEGANIWRPGGDGFKVAAMFGHTPEHRAALKHVIPSPEELPASAALCLREERFTSPTQRPIRNTTHRMYWPLETYHDRRSTAPRRRSHWCSGSNTHGGAAFYRKTDRARDNLRRPGGDRDRERAPVQGNHGGAGAADRDQRDPAGDQPIADGRAAGDSTRSSKRAPEIVRGHLGERRDVRRRANPCLPHVRAQHFRRGLILL